MNRKQAISVILGFCVISLETFKITGAAPFYSTLTDPGTLSPRGTYTNRVIVAEIDKPIETIMEAVTELGGNILFLVPPREYEKRDPPDLGTNRSYSGQRTAKVMYGQLASSSPSGPGRRKRYLNPQSEPKLLSPYDGSYSFIEPGEKLK
ncbi:unnamed protein product [Orchesella dallaii]|uniref:Uncharacterized protein n=1 Tax=Orchesella dallaii TaxID=48710 RepID=A0ABP1QC42_9HEXA